MSQGFFGIVEFGGSIENPEALTIEMGDFLSRNGRTHAEVSYLVDEQYVLGMKRLPYEALQQRQIYLIQKQTRP